MGKITTKFTHGKLFLMRSWKKYIFVILLVLVQCRLFQNNVEAFGRFAKKIYELSVGDYIINFFMGTLPYNMLGDQPFNIPGIWSLYFIYFFVLIGRRVSRISLQHEQQLMLRRITRKKWWGCQNLGLCMEIAGYLIVTYLTFLIYGIISGAKIFGINEELQADFNSMSLKGNDGTIVLLKLILLSFIITLAITYIQYIVSLLVNAIIGIVVSAAILVSSVFYMNPVLLLNYLMVMRDKELLTGGVNMWVGIVIAAVIVAAMVFAGSKIIEKKDIF